MQKKARIYNNKRNQRGITLVTLVITIIVLLILAGVTLNAIFGESGIISNAQKAKENAEIAEEKELIGQAAIIALAKSKTGAITVEGMQKAMNDATSEGNTTVIDNTDTIVVKFNDSNRHYEIDEEGNAAGPKELINDENAGDLSKGGKYTGEAGSPFVINCIEDLVEFSKNYTKYQNSNVILARTLDFNSIFSYNDYTSKDYGDLNGDGAEENIKTELIKQGENCVGFTPIENFYGTFDGQNNKICNLYESRGEERAGLFNYNCGIIKNLGLENINLAGSNYIGGISASTTGADNKILNCFVGGSNTIRMTNTTGDTYIGLIVGLGESAIIEKNHSEGEVEINATKSSFGGIAGRIVDGTIISKCYNVMNIDTPYTAGGIVGFIQGSTVTVEECFHIGDIFSEGNTTTSGGIAANGVNGTIKNCYNIGSIGNYWSGGIVSGYSSIDCFNCYSVGEITSPRYISGGTISGLNEGGHIVHCFGRRGDFGTLPEGELTEEQIISYLSKTNSLSKGHADKTQLGYECNILTDDEMKTQSFADELNILIEAGKSGDTEGVITETEQSVWKMDTEGINNGYPIFTWQE